MRLKVPRPPVTAKCKTTDDNGQFAYKKTEKKNKRVNNPRTKQHICKPRHTSRCFNLQKSCFLADAPADIYIFAVI